MRKKVDLIGGPFDGMSTYIEPGQQEVNLMYIEPEPVKLDDDLYPTSTSKLQVLRYRRQLKYPYKYELVKQ